MRPAGAVRKALRGLAMVSLISLLGLLAYLTYLRLSGNFHVVSEGQLLRAGQMDGQRLVRWQRDYGIATVLNLRGAKPGADWYETELAVSERLGIGHIDFAMSDNDELSRAEVEALLAVMRDAPKPLLVHCFAGADRTGLASALYLAAIERRSEWAAEWQLSLAYGHVGIPLLSRAWPMTATFEKMEPWLGFPDS